MSEEVAYQLLSGVLMSVVSSAPSFHSVRWEPRIYPGDPARTIQVRADIRHDLRGFPDDLIWTVQLCCSELYTNAVLHTVSGAPGGEVARRLWLHRPDTLRLEVADGGWTTARPALPPDRDGSAWLTSEGQRGLLLVNAFAIDWGYDQVLPYSQLNLGLAVWADFRVDPGDVPRGLDHFIFTG
ncbi:ATP-binding protein [Nocardiopsis rhodophaea]